VNKRKHMTTTFDGRAHPLFNETRVSGARAMPRRLSSLFAAPWRIKQSVGGGGGGMAGSHDSRAYILGRNFGGGGGSPQVKRPSRSSKLDNNGRDTAKCSANAKLATQAPQLSKC
jgi:hypothetical protein